MISVDVVVDHFKWKKKIKNLEIFFNRIVKFFPKKYSFGQKKVKLTLLLSNNYSIKKLNQKFRKKNKPTDILSFPLKKRLRNEYYLGDIIISYDFMNNSKSPSILLFKKKVIKIFIHGFLHLIGFDHKKVKDYKKMQIEEIKIFNLVEKKFEKIN